MTQEKKQITITGRQLYLVSTISYVIALATFITGWLVTGPHWIPLAFCIPLVILTPAVFTKRRRYFQLIPNLLVIYVCWSLVERFINPAMASYSAISLVAWTVSLFAMLMLIRTSYLVDGGHYVPDPEKKAKRLARKQARAEKRAGKKAS